MLIIDLIEQTTFSSSEDEAVNYILSQGYNVHHLTLKQMFKESYTSSATFVRVAQRLGFTGWNEFKVDFLKEITYFDRQANMIDLNIPFDNTDSVLSIANKITELKKESLNDTIELLSYKTLQTAVDMLNDASEVKVFASNVNSILAEEFQFKMNRIQKPVLLSSLEGEHIYDVLNMKEGAVAIVISYSGSSKKWMKSCKHFSLRKSPSLQ